MSHYVKGVVLNTKQGEDYTDKDSVIHQSFTITVLEGSYPIQINARVLPVVEKGKEYLFPVLVFPKYSKAKDKAYIFYALASDEQVVSAD